MPAVTRTGVVVAASLAFAAGCAARSAPPAGTGRITVGVTTTGGLEPGTTFEVVIEPAGRTARIRADAGVYSVPDAPAGEHVVRLRDLGPGCTVEGGAERTVRLGASRSTTVRFVVHCEDKPAPSSFP
jgi:hypothetical protein